MSILKMSEAEKKKILEKHKNATKEHLEKKEDEKKGLKKPEAKK